jgi:hypothetical protein
MARLLIAALAPGDAARAGNMRSFPMAEDREAIQQHVQLVRERLYPAIRVDRFPDAKKLTARVETIVGDWKAGRAPDASGVIEAVNEICVAIELLRQKLTAHFTLIYEPSVTLTGRSIDFLLSYGDQRQYYDVKTITPRAPEDAKLKWEKYAEMRSLFPTNTALILAEQWMGGEFWHFFSSARAKFLDYTLALERKVAALPKTSAVTVRMVFCGDRIRWTRDQLEDFADFYRTGIFRPDDPLRKLQAHFLTEKGLVLERTIHGFCYMKRAPLDLRSSSFMMDVRGP